MKDLAEFISLLPSRIMRALLGLVIIGLFMGIVYAYSPAGPQMRDWMIEASEHLPEGFPEIPGLPTAAPAPSSDPAAPSTAAPSAAVTSTAGPASSAPASAAPASPGSSAVDPEGSFLATASAVIDKNALATLNIETPSSAKKYERAAFGPAWQDVDRNGCDTRNDILARDLSGETFKPRTHDCVVLTGTLHDPYSGQIIAFDKSLGSNQIDVDHVIPLGLAWESGASTWSDTRRLEYANDPMVLVAVNAKDNRSKSDQSISEWMPANEAVQCQYAAQYVAVASKYDLSVSREDFQVLTQMQGRCGG